MKFETEKYRITVNDSCIEITHKDEEKWQERIGSGIKFVGKPTLTLTYDTLYKNGGRLMEGLYEKG